MLKLLLPLLSLSILPLALGDSIIRLTLPGNTKYQETKDINQAYRLTEPRDLVFTDDMINKKQTIDFYWVRYVQDEHAFSQDPTWNMTCHTKVDSPLNNPVEFILHDGIKEGFEGPKDTPAHIWCPQDQAHCEPKTDCSEANVIPVVDSAP